MNKEKLEAIRQGASRWHSASSDLVLLLVAEVERLQKELEKERVMHDCAKAFHDVAVQQRNSAWQELATIKKHGLPPVKEEGK